MKAVKIVSLLLSLILTLSLFAACGAKDNGKESEQETTQAEKDTNGTDTPAKETETEAIKPTTLPEKQNFDFDFEVLHWTVGGQAVGEGWIPWEEIAVDEDTGDGLVKEVFDRNNLLEEQYGIRVHTTYENTEPITNIVQNMISTGEDNYQMVVQRGYQFQFLMTTNSFADMSSLSTMDLSKPWYNQDSVNTFTFGGKTIMATSDLLLLDKGATAAVYYNKELANENNFAENYFYNKVNNYEWTLQELVNTMEAVYQDATGDGYTTDDIFGAEGGDDPMHFVFNGAGERFCVSDPDEYLRYTFYSERALDVVDSILNDLCLNSAYLSGTNYDTSDVKNPFSSNHVFFSFGTIKSVGGLRSMVAPYGILPIPMYEESQKQYYSEISPHHGSLFAIPATAVINPEEADIVGIVVEDLSYISSTGVYPELYNVVLEGKGTRDQESREMLKLIFDTRMFDLGIIFDFNQFADHVLRLPGKNKSIVTLWAEDEEGIDAALEKTVEALKKLD